LSAKIPSLQAVFQQRVHIPGSCSRERVYTYPNQDYKSVLLTRNIHVSGKRLSQIVILTCTRVSPVIADQPLGDLNSHCNNSRTTGIDLIIGYVCPCPPHWQTGIEDLPLFRNQAHSIDPRIACSFLKFTLNVRKDFPSCDSLAECCNVDTRHQHLCPW
jgi:hypothetical protein